MIRIGEINYLNVYPIFYFLKKEAEEKESELNFLSFKSGTPAFLNNSLKNGFIDLSPSSSFYYIENYSNSLLFKNISISSKKKVNSIFLFSPKKIEDFSDTETIYITPETLTSVNLLKILLSEFYAFDINKMNFVIMSSNENIELTKNAGLLDGCKIYLHIGDKAIEYKKNYKNVFKYSFDLAAIWYSFTRLPFVFALFIIRKDSYENNKNEFNMLYKYLIKSKDKAVANLDEIAQEILKNPYYKFITYNELINYWTDCLSFDLSKKEIEGFTLYSDLLYKHKIIKDIPKLNFIG
ncbi:MAG: menaquinone biosynthesis protein [Deltaproteobacteria bacterium]|nr:menaquinone biosynthesis protein [Deltaproteobacteria bacterium]